MCTLVNFLRCHFQQVLNSNQDHILHKYNVGFLEVLDDLGGKSDVAEIASKQGLELDYLLPILESGEMLGFIQVQAGDVSITEKGHLFIAASPKVRKKILRDI